MTVRDELRARALFEQRYGIAAAPLLREIERRVIGSDWGANGFTTIFETPGMPPAARRRARAAGPRAVAMRSDHHRLLRSAGFSAITEVDLTPAFSVTAAAWLAESEVHATELARLEPPGGFQQRQADRRAMLAPIDAGLLRRVVLLARRG
jgi:hypothetical protein